MTLTALAQKLQLPDVIPAIAAGDYIQLISSTASNRVQQIKIGGRTFSGAELRKALNLKSSLISWQIDGEKITFVTSGYGHGVGLCQYGADHYARQGDDYRQILNRYYPGAQLSLE
jgi:stage II sporulation protein D